MHTKRLAFPTPPRQSGTNCSTEESRGSSLAGRAWLLAGIVLLTASLGCSEKATTNPVFQEVGYLTGQVIYDDGDPPPTLRIERRSDSSFRMFVETDENGRFTTPLADGIYLVGVLPEDDEYPDSWMTPTGFVAYGDFYESRIPVLSGKTSAVIGTLGRLSVEIDTRIETNRSWNLSVDDWNDGGGSVFRSVRTSTDQGMLSAEMLRLPVGPYQLNLRTPYGEGFDLDVERDGQRVALVDAELHASEPYRATLPEPITIRARTSRIVDAPDRAFYSIGVFAETLYGEDPGTSLVLSADGSEASADFALYGRSPFRVRYRNFNFEGWVGSRVEEDATMFAPEPGDDLEVVLELGLLRFEFPPELADLGIQIRIEAPGTNSVRSTSVVHDPPSGAAVSWLVGPPGTYTGIVIPPSDLRGVCYQEIEHPLEIVAGETQTYELNPHEGVTIRGRLGADWESGDRFLARLFPEDITWYLNPEVDSDGRTYAIHNLPQGDILLTHERGGRRFYYPGTPSQSDAELIAIEGPEDLDDIDFTR